MYATIHPRTPTLAGGRTTADAPLHTALLTTAAVIIGSFLIAIALIASLMLAGPLPASSGAAPMPQMLPQPSAAAGLDR